MLLVMTLSCFAQERNLLLLTKNNKNVELKIVFPHRRHVGRQIAPIDQIDRFDYEDRNQELEQ